ncbi:MAG: DUF4838 domain-containing protein [Planctomycetes bacterium]|nr:DUF4838 domain-containing protein [Planctomycetota bacterium]
MLRTCMLSVWVVFLLGGMVAAQEMTAEQYLAGPALEAVRTEGVPDRTIVLDGKPAATIYLRKGAQDREIEAATELQDYIAKATGAVLPIVREPDEPKGHAIRIGTRTPAEGASSEAFSVKVGPNQTDIVGNSPIAALYGACELLERGVGVRWYLPGPMGEVVPKCKTLTLPALDVKESPSFPMRWIGRGKWALRNKQNRCDDGFLIYPGIYHTQNRILPHKQYFKEHPEYFALINGKRSAERVCKLCYSNPDCVREVARNMAKMLDENPNIDLISLSPTDGQMWCECDGCRAMDPEGVTPNKRQPRDAAVPNDRAMSRRSLLFYNAVARELRKTHPKAKMLVGAYNVYNWPPKDPNVKADPMLAVIITHYDDYCMAHPVPDPACPLNQRYVKLIKEWQDMGCAIYYYEYYWKVNWLDLPWPIVHSIKGDMPWYKKQGHQGVYTQYTESNIWTLFPGHYVAARLLWDVNADVDAIVDKMYDDLFGAAAPHMKKYYALMEKQMAECGEHFPGQGLRFGPAVFTDDVRAKLHEYYDNAVKANDDEVVAFRLKKVGTSLEYVDRLMRYRRLVGQTTSEKDPAKALVFAEEALKVGETLVNEIRTNREKWGGVVSTSVVSKRYYLGRHVENWRTVVAKRRAKRTVTVDKIVRLPKAWRFSLDKDDVGQKEGWFKSDFDDSAWKPIEIGKTWESQGYDYDGFAWYRMKFDVKPEWLKTPVALHFSAVDGEGWVYWNGTLLGHHKGWDEPFTLPIKSELITTDKPNVIAVRVYDGSNAGGIYRPAYLVKRK